MTIWKIWQASAGACDNCSALAGQSVEEDDYFDAGWGDIDGPDENHPHCGCAVELYDVPDQGYAAQLADQIMGQ